MALINVNAVTSWSPSRLEKYEQCPLLFKLETLMKVCPACFRGALRGEFGGPQHCDACGATEEVPGPIARGTEIGGTLERYVNGKASRVHTEVKHPKVLEIAKTLRKEYKASKGQAVRVEFAINLTKDWTVVPADQSKFRWREIWLRTKLDVFLLILAKKLIRVIDWKSGGIDKKTGAVRADTKYDDQLDLYKLASLVAFPQVETAEAALAFTDCGARFDPLIERGQMKRVSIPKEQKRWEQRVVPLFKDRTFAPRASTKCTWCKFSKGKGGPCPY